MSSFNPGLRSVSSKPDHRFLLESAALQGVGSAITIADLDGNYVFANDTAVQLWGFASVEELLNKPNSHIYSNVELFDENGAPLISDHLSALLTPKKAKELPEIVFQLQRKGHSNIQTEGQWISASAKVIADGDGEIAFALTIYQDITARKLAEFDREKFQEEALIERARLEAVLNQVETGVIIVDAKTKDAVFINEMIKKMWRHPFVPTQGPNRYSALKAERLDGTSVGPDEWPSLLAINRGVSIKDQELKAIRGDGTVAYLRVNSDPIRNRKGEVIAAIITVQDITELRKQEQGARLLDEASRILPSSLDFQKILKTIADLAVPRLGDWCAISIVERSASSIVVVANNSPEMIQVAEEYRTKYPTDWSAPAGPAYSYRTGKSMIMPVVTEQMLEIAARDEEHLRLLKTLKISSLIYVPIVGHKNPLGVITLASSDPSRPYSESELRIAEELGRRAGLAIENARLYEEAQKAISSRDSLISVSAHELLTPISGSKLQMQLIKKRMKQGLEVTPEMVKKMVDQTERQLDRLDRLVNEMLDLSRINLGKLTIRREQTHLSDLVKDLLDRMQGQLQSAECIVTTEIAPNIQGFLDSYRIEQVLTNLLSNAIRYARGKSVHISLYNLNSSTVALVVEDQGIGIRKADHERIFQRFERAVTIDEGCGLGLGLFVVRQIVEAHGGSVSLESELGKGSKFTVCLPLNEGKDL